MTKEEINKEDDIEIPCDGYAKGICDGCDLSDELIIEQKLKYLDNIDIE